MLTKRTRSKNETKKGEGGGRGRNTRVVERIAATHRKISRVGSAGRDGCASKNRGATRKKYLSIGTRLVAAGVLLAEAKKQQQWIDPFWFHKYSLV